MSDSITPLEIDLTLYTRKRLIVTMRVAKNGDTTPQIVLEAEDGSGTAVALFGQDSPAARADAARMMNLWNATLRTSPQLTTIEALRLTLEWIDSIPPETVLPAMPGFDRDWVDTFLEPAPNGMPLNSIEEALELAIEWVKAVPVSVRDRLKHFDIDRVESAITTPGV